VPFRKFIYYEIINLTINKKYIKKIHGTSCIFSFKDTWVPLPLSPTISTTKKWM